MCWAVPRAGNPLLFRRKSIGSKYMCISLLEVNVPEFLLPIFRSHTQIAVFNQFSIYMTLCVCVCVCLCVSVRECVCACMHEYKCVCACVYIVMHAQFNFTVAILLI